MAIAARSCGTASCVNDRIFVPLFHIVKCGYAFNCIDSRQLIAAMQIWIIGFSNLENKRMKRRKPFSSSINYTIKFQLLYYEISAHIKTDAVGCLNNRAILSRVMTAAGSRVAPRLVLIDAHVPALAAMQYQIAVELFGYDGACLRVGETRHRQHLIGALVSQAQHHDSLLVLLSARSDRARLRHCQPTTLPLGRRRTTTSTPATSKPSGAVGKLSNTMASAGTSISRPSPST